MELEIEHIRTNMKGEGRTREVLKMFFKFF